MALLGRLFGRKRITGVSVFAGETPGDVGGLDVLKDWLRVREKAFTQDAADYGLSVPKGITLIGIPGTGKSLTAKMVAGLWRLPWAPAGHGSGVR